MAEKLFECEWTPEGEIILRIKKPGMGMLTPEVRAHMLGRPQGDAQRPPQPHRRRPRQDGGRGSSADAPHDNQGGVGVGTGVAPASASNRSRSFSLVMPCTARMKSPSEALF